MSIIQFIKKGVSRPLRWILAAGLIVAAATPSSSQAAGLLIADGGLGGALEIEEHDVQVTINNGVAVTHVTQVFHNTENRQVEALYTFPVPKQASVSNFSMWINGTEMVGEVLEKERARQIYNTYKQQARPKDPGLLEQVDYKTFEMRIFPINPDARQKVQITYYQELEIDHDQVTYVYPLATVSRGHADARVLGRFAFQTVIKAAIPISALGSPSHGEAIVVADHDDLHKTASLEQRGGSLAKDIVIHYALKRPQSGIDLITSRGSNDDGFFYLTVTAGEDLARLDMGMDYLFLLDISGSMANDGKLSISRQSVGAFIDELGADDRLEVMTFNVQPTPVFNTLRNADSEAKASAHRFLDSQMARGGTILAPALTTAYKYADADRPLNVVILSDGMTEQNERAQLIGLIGQRPRNARVFCIGIGNEINRPLLDQIAAQSGGLAAFVSGGDDFARQAKAFRRKLMHPAVADPTLTIEGVKTFDVVPAKLPNLYHGAPIRIYGRYSGQGSAQIALSGTIQGKLVKQTIQLPFPAVDSKNPEIERMWAMKRVDELLKRIDAGEPSAELQTETVRLGEAFSIVTPYTSFLVLENDAEYKRWQIERRNLDRMQRDRTTQSERQRQLQAIRDKALQHLGPQAAAPAAQPLAVAPAQPPASPTLNPPKAPPVQPSVNRPQSRDFSFGGGGGSGPVGPLFVGLAYLLMRRKQRR